MLVWQNHNKCHANDPHEIYTHIPHSFLKTLTICPLETSNLSFLKTTEESSFCVPCLGEWCHYLLIIQAPNLKGHYYFSCSLIAHDDGDDLVAKSCLTLVIPWTEACQAPLSMGFSRQDYWSGWVAIFFSRGSSQPRERTQVSYAAGRFFTHWATLHMPLPNSAD